MVCVCSAIGSRGDAGCDLCGCFGNASAGEAASGAGRGRRRRADFTANGHASRYTHDERGPTISEALWVADEGYTATTVFDSMDRVSTTVCPDGEVITQTYDDEGVGLLAGVEGDNVYVSGGSYTATGEMQLPGARTAVLQAAAKSRSAQTTPTLPYR